MTQNPYEAPRESGIKAQKPRAWNAAGIAIAVAIGIIATISLLDLFGYWLSLRH